MQINMFDSIPIKSKEIEPGVIKCSISLDLLYESDRDRSLFEDKWNDFYNSDYYNKYVFEKSDNQLHYLSEHIIPLKKDDRPSILLLFGNPASHSVHERMYFAFEGSGREHRLWRIFRDIELIDFENEPLDSFSHNEINKLRKERLYSLDYSSPYRIGFACFFSCPSTPTTPPWSGVSGVQKLFGSKATQKILEFERQRIKETTESFLNPNERILAFQKDAFINICINGPEAYNFKQLIQSPIQSKYIFNESIDLYCVPPTRFMQGKKAKEALKTAIAIY